MRTDACCSTARGIIYVIATKTMTMLQPSEVDALRSGAVTKRSLMTYLVSGRHQAARQKEPHMQQRVAIVTGASSGIGLTLTRSLSARGYAVIGTSRNASHCPDRRDGPGSALPG
jgi:NADPH:quinone reductase-like Zn-dependent oxidoreductase